MTLPAPVSSPKAPAAQQSQQAQKATPRGYLAAVAPPKAQAKAPNLLGAILEHLRQAGQIAGLARAEIDRLLTPERSVRVQFDVAMDDGSTRTLTGWRVLHSSARGAAKGGIRFAAGVDQNTVRALATEMSNKCAIYELPL